MGFLIMSEEKKVDLSSLDGITDRVARAKAKAEAVRKARAAGPQAPRPAQDQVEAPDPAPASVPASGPEAGAKADLSNLDSITDRVARAKAKAEAVRKARAEGPQAGTQPAAEPTPLERKPKREPEARPETMAGKKAAAKTRPETLAGAPAPLEGDRAMFSPGMTIWRNGKLARVINREYENVCLVYQDNPGERVMTKVYRLDVERRKGTLSFASANDFTAALSPRVGGLGRGLAFLLAAGFTGAFFLGTGLLIGPLSVFPTVLVGYVLFAFAHHATS